jgi:hypothetical protein
MIFVRITIPTINQAKVHTYISFALFGCLSFAILLDEREAALAKMRASAPDSGRTKQIGSGMQVRRLFFVRLGSETNCF